MSIKTLMGQDKPWNSPRILLVHLNGVESQAKPKSMRVQSKAFQRPRASQPTEKS